MNKFSFYIALLIIGASTLFGSCKKDDEIRATISISRQSIFFSELNMQSEISYSGTEIERLTFDTEDVPEGWEININRGAQIITVTGPKTQADFDNSLNPSTISFQAVSRDNQNTYDYLTVGTTERSIDLSDQQANCFVADQPNTVYTFSSLYKGEKQGNITPAYVDILWQSSPAPLSYARLNGDNVEFHVGYIDPKEDITSETEMEIQNGNAVIAAYDSKGTILWSWHIWVTDMPSDNYSLILNGKEIMKYNLGAYNNSTENSETILESYGLYYQWGRKDPFTKPYVYNASKGSDEYITNEIGARTYVSYTASTSKTGNENYTTKHPLTYITGVEKSSYDWRYSDHSSDLWSETKTVNDPCPKGWRVASEGVLSNLQIPTLSQDEHDSIYNDYGWMLSDKSGNEALFMGLGRRIYLTGVIQNINLNETRPAPWAGYYWTLGASSDNKSVALYFAYDKTDAANNTISNENLYRSNGMQIRCQRDE